MLCIGLGGFGSAVVDRLAVRAFGGKESTAAFAAIDVEGRGKNARAIPWPNQLVLRPGARVPRTEDWMGLEPERGGNTGAGAIRRDGRLAFYRHSAEVGDFLTRLIRQLLYANGQLDIHVFCSLAGGFGSGAVISLAYLLRHVAAGLPQNVSVFGHLALSPVLQGVLRPEMMAFADANSYAALKEVEHLNGLGYPELGRKEVDYPYLLEAKGAVQRMVRRRPFDQAFLYDGGDAKGSGDAVAQLADSAHHGLFSSLFPAVLSAEDNYERSRSTLWVERGERQRVGRTRNFARVRTTSLYLPAEELLRYAAMRETARAVREHFTLTNTPEAWTAQMKPIGRSGDMKAALASGHAGQVFVAYVQAALRLRTEEIRSGLGGPWSTADDLAHRFPARLERALEAMPSSPVGLAVARLTFGREGVSLWRREVDRLIGVFANAEIAAKAEFVSWREIGLPQLLGGPDLRPYMSFHLSYLIESYLIPEARSLSERNERRSASDRPERAHLGSERADEVLRAMERELSEAANARRLWFLPDEVAFAQTRERASALLRLMVADTLNHLQTAFRLRVIITLIEWLQAENQHWTRALIDVERELDALDVAAQRLPSGQTAAGAAVGTAHWELPADAAGIEALRSEVAGREWGEWFKRQNVQFGDAVYRPEVASALGFGQEARSWPAPVDPRRSVNGLLAHATDLLRPRIFPSPNGQGGLSLPEALDLEATLVSGSGQSKQWHIAAKLRSVVDTLSFPTETSGGGDASSSTFEAAWVVIGSGTASTGQGGEFTAALRDSLGTHTTLLEDESLGIHKVILARTELGLPAYKFPCVAGRLKQSYLKVQGDPRTAVILHTSAAWETSLPNLDPFDPEPNAVNPDKGASNT